jgi:coproporphyrinogen III oxidase
MKSQSQNFAMKIEKKQQLTSAWFKELRDKICAQFEQIEDEFAAVKNLEPGKFKRKAWDRDGGGGGEMSLMTGNVFEKVGVNISTVFGEFGESFKDQIPGANEDPRFWANGISVVAHMASPLVPAVHMNTRFICTTKNWFGGGSDLNPMFEIAQDTKDFHTSFKDACDKYDKSYYPKFKAQCDEYFFIKHRNEARGVGGIFYDYLNTDNFENDFNFTKDVGLAFLNVYPKLIKKHMLESWSEKQREFQLRKRGRYAEFNLVYDRGTKFGLMTNGNPEAILMSLPPVVKWD